VKLAEAEADGSGPTARVVSALLARLGELPDVRVVRHFDRRLWLDWNGSRIELDLERIVALTDGEPEDVLSHAIERLCSALVVQASPALEWASARERLYPRLVGRTFLDGLPDREDLHVAALGAGVWITLVLRYKDRARYVRKLEVQTWSKQGAVPRLQALQNLARSCGRARFLQHDTPHGPLVIAQTGDGLDSARLLLPGLHEVLAPALGPEFVASVPHRDTLLACPLGPAPLLETLRSRADAALRSAPHAIAPTLWRISGPGKLQAY